MMTDEQFAALADLMAWHVSSLGAHESIDFNVIERVLGVLKRERNGRPVTVAIVPLVEDPGLCHRRDWRDECHRRINAALMDRPQR